MARARPSAGCEECRRSKKRCDLELPACGRCLRLRKQCSGARDMKQLQFFDESQAVKLKALGKSATPPQSALRTPCSATTGQFSNDITLENATPLTDDASLDNPSFKTWVDHAAESEHNFSPLRIDSNVLRLAPLSSPEIKPKADDIALHSFLVSFTSSKPGLWNFMRAYALESRADSCLDRAVRACGMAALVGTRNVMGGMPYARGMYTQALGRINAALRDPQRSRSDECLIAVLLMGYYETLASSGEESFRSWKVHTNGLREMLKLRGRGQLGSLVGRHLFREIEAHIITQSIWDAEDPPGFLLEWEDDLEAMSAERTIAPPPDSLTKICISYAKLKSALRLQSSSEGAAASEAFNLANRLDQWSSEAISLDKAWRYTEVDVPDSPHVWNGMMHVYSCRFAPGAWMAYRCVRIQISQTQEMLSTILPVSGVGQEAQFQQYRRVQRETTNDICAAIPSILGYSSLGDGEFCALNNVYSVIWPLYLAGNSVLARSRTQNWQAIDGDALRLPQASATFAQAAWIIGRLDYISTRYGLKWASVMAATLRSSLTNWL